MTTSTSGTGSTPTPGAMPRRAAVPSPAQLAGTHRRTPAAAATPKTDAHAWGRVADDGTVYRRTSDGTEVEIAQWQAGSPEAGLAHFAARYEDLAAEVSVLESRLASHPENAGEIRSSAQVVLDSLPQARVIGDLEALRRRLTAVLEGVGDAQERAKHDREERRAKALAARERLAEEAEKIAAESTEWKAAGDRLRAILEEWRGIRGLDRATDDALWRRYSRARDAFNRRRGAHFAELDRNRAAARAHKEDLIARAISMQNCTDWAEGSRFYHELLDEWKTTPRIGREEDKSLWKRFHEAQDVFFHHRNEADQARIDDELRNAAIRDSLLEHYTPLIKPDENLEKARRYLKELQIKWDETGRVPNYRVNELEESLRALANKVSESAKAQWRASDPEAQARADQFSAKAQDLAEQAQRAEEAGKSKKAAQLREQAQQWKEWAEAAHSALKTR